uniref:Uncharacterized protein n=1 Tax=Nelumbo nucifera TaxID=4432 RepID=A0A822Z070_NELNU|nr:TPA_asm: hypothetical protein HUJ06_007540 [Nelumbo nucifera]
MYKRECMLLPGLFIGEVPIECCGHRKVTYFVAKLLESPPIIVEKKGVMRLPMFKLNSLFDLW